jgi:hypothetical protein
MKVLKPAVLLPALAIFLLTGADVPRLDNPITEKYISKNLRKGHPKLVYTSKLVSDVRKKVRTDPVSRNLYSAIKKNANKVYGEPLLELSLIGRRLLSVSRELLYRVNMLGFIYLVDEDNKALDRINEELIAVCNFSDWNPSHFLDVAEMAMGVALAVDWTRGNLPQTTIELAKKTLIDKAIMPSWPAAGKEWRLSRSTNNWNQVCAGGLIAASIIIADKEPELAARTIHRSIEGLPNALVAYSPDGVYPEGSTYWGYATIYSVVTASLLETAFGHDFGHWEYPGFRESATFRVLANAPSGWYYNYFDCGDKRSINGDITLAWFAYKTGDGTFFEKERFLQPAEEMERLHRFAGASMAWISQFSKKETGTIPTAWKGAGTNPIAIFKNESSDAHTYYLGCKGGRASLSHGNMDAGSFVFELNGVRWVVDPGNQGYHDLEKTGFNLWRKEQDSDRWTLLTKNNFGHSTITVNNQPFIYDAFAPMTGFRSGDKPEVSFDLSAVYGENIKSVQRSFRKESASSLLIEDRLTPSEKTELITWQLVTIASVEVIDGGAILSQDGKKLKLENLSHPDIMISVVSLDPPPLELDRRIKGLKRIEIRIPAWTINKGSTTLKIRLSEH